MSGQRRILGRSVARLEDLPLLRGQGQFVADIAFPHQLHMRIVRAPYAHGELRSVDVAAARAAPGVAAVWSGADIADLPPIDFRDPAGETLRPYRQPLLAQKRVRYEHRRQLLDRQRKGRHQNSAISRRRFELNQS